MPPFDPEQWRALGPYLDKALEISPEQRTGWLEALRSENPAVAMDLQTLLMERDAVGDEEWVKMIPRSSLAPLVGQTVGAYTLESPIGQGGMGTVWLARRSDGRFEGRAAVKFLNVGLLGGAGEQRFRREGSILARLAHPNIAHLIDAGVSSTGAPYLILEYVQGKNIDAYCNEHALGVEARLRLFVDVLAPVAHAHANLIVHRDIKPSNVLVTGDGQVKLLDFGIAKLLDDESGAPATILTRQGEQALTLAYAAPEQVTGYAITTGTDVYTLGVLLYQLLTGKHPAASALQSPVDLMKAIVDTQPARPSDITDSGEKWKRALRGDLDTIVGKAMKKNPAERYTSATAFADDLRCYLRHQPISARPDTLAYRAKKFVRRNYIAVALASAAIVATGAGLFGTLVQARRATRAAEQARVEARNATAVKDFLLGIFNKSSKRQADPLRAQSVTARELLDSGAERLLADRVLDSQVALQLLSTVGDLYMGLGLDEKSVQLRQKRVELARRTYKPNDVRLAVALVDYANSVYATPRAKESLAILQEAERILEANGDQTSAIRVACDKWLAAYWRTVGDQGKARSYAMKAVEISRRYHPNTELLAGALHQAALAENFAHNTSASLELYKESVELYRRLGTPEIELIRPVTEMAEQETALARFAEAERDFKETVAMSLRVNGEDHVDTIQTRLRYGGFLRTVGRLRESEVLLRKAVDSGVRVLGPEESFHLPTARFELGRTLAELGKLEEAELMYQQALAVREKTRPNTYQHANMLENAAVLQMAMGRYELADRMLSQSSSILEKIGRPESATLFRARYQLAVGEAEQALSTVATSTLSGGGSLQNSFVAGLIRSRALLHLGRPEEAERIASESLDRLSTTQGAEVLQFSRANLLVSHGLALTRLGRAKEALTPLRDALAWREANLDENSPVVAESLIALAECYLSQGERTQARSLVERAQRIYQSHPNLGERARLPLRKVEELLSVR